MSKQQQPLKLTREDKAVQLFQARAVSKSKTSDDLYYVNSQENPRIAYQVIPSMNVCTCIDFERSGQACKHILATQILDKRDSCSNNCCKDFCAKQDRYGGTSEMNNDGDCFGHDYEYQESLPSGSNAVRALVLYPLRS